MGRQLIAVLNESRFPWSFKDGVKLRCWIVLVKIRAIPCGLTFLRQDLLFVTDYNLQTEALFTVLRQHFKYSLRFQMRFICFQNRVIYMIIDMEEHSSVPPSISDITVCGSGEGVRDGVAVDVVGDWWSMGLRKLPLGAVLTQTLAVSEWKLH